MLAAGQDGQGVWHAVLSTVGVKLGYNGPTLPSVLSELDGIEPIDRTSMNAFEDEAFRQAVQATG